jgi:hypothetical protein
MGDRETWRECHYFVCGAFETLMPEKWLLLNEILLFIKRLLDFKFMTLRGKI